MLVHCYQQRKAYQRQNLELSNIDLSLIVIHLHKDTEEIIVQLTCHTAPAITYSEETATK